MRLLARRRSLFLLTAILLVAMALRFAGLGSKPLWIDEAMTALVALGRGPDDVPLGVARPLTALASIFSLNPAATWLDVVTRLVDPAVEHTHPPVFYVLMHSWLAWLAPPLSRLAWSLRAVAAAFGVLAVALIFGLARSAFGERAGLIAAALAAVSPAMVMIAQEGRNYTLPLGLLTAALWVMVAMVKRLTDRRSIPAALWASWTAINVFACYAHYYDLLVFAAQALTLALLMVRERSLPQLWWLAVSLTAAGVAFLPWLATLFKHSVSPEQGWMRLTSSWRIFHDTLHAWRAMVAGIGWERGTPVVAATTQAATLIFGVWALGIMTIGLGRRLRAASRPPAADALLLVVVITLVELFVASLAYDKNLVSEVRYHFVYYPALVAVFGWIVAELPARAATSWRRALIEPTAWVALSAILLGGGVSAAATDVGLEFPKDTEPDRVGAALAAATATPVLVVMGSGSFHETVIQLTYLLELSRRSPAVGETEFAFVVRSNRYTSFGRRSPPSIFWTGFAHVGGITNRPATLWVNGVGLRTSEYPQRLEVKTRDGERRPCTFGRGELARLDEDDHDRDLQGFRLYHCGPVGARRRGAVRDEPS
jgi:uncharacterized membrane protein